MKTGIATMVSVLALAALVVPALAAPAGAGPVPAVSGGAPETWAFGAQYWDNRTASTPFGEYNTSAFFGWHEVITLTNTSNTTVQLEGVRTIGVHYYAQFCHPDCTSPNVTATISVRAWQEDRAFVNLTTNATVYEHGPNGSMPAAALGLLNASDSGKANLTEGYQIVRGGHTVATGRLDVARSDAATIAFTPSLGLVPWNVTAGERWNASAMFAASGGWNDSYSYLDTLRGTSSSSSGTSSGSVNRSGIVGLRGADLGNLTLKNGRTVTVITFAVGGPFEFRDGVFLAPAGSDLFSGPSPTWAVHEYGAPQANAAAADVVVDAAHHSALVEAASANVQAQATPLGTSTVATGTSTPLTTPPPTTNSSLQAQPETVQVADAQSACLVSGCGSAASSGSSGTPVLFGVLIGAAAVVVLVGVVAVLRMRPKRPTPSTVPVPPMGPGPSA
ncbi:MAG TPA: hypothetical protein VLY85_00990 [Thermoplasmata archaeon]|nr:hypothetical protein [Thermoplasmata archaeon]